MKRIVMIVAVLMITLTAAKAQSMNIRVVESQHYKPYVRNSRQQQDFIISIDVTPNTNNLTLTLNKRPKQSYSCTINDVREEKNENGQRYSSIKCKVLNSNISISINQWINDVGAWVAINKYSEEEIYYGVEI